MNKVKSVFKNILTIIGIFCLLIGPAIIVEAIYKIAGI